MLGRINWRQVLYRSAPILQPLFRTSWINYFSSCSFFSFTMFTTYHMLKTYRLLSPIWGHPLALVLLLIVWYFVFGRYKLLHTSLLSACIVLKIQSLESVFKSLVFMTLILDILFYIGICRCSVMIALKITFWL